MNAHDRPEFSVDQIDHVELFVPDRRKAAAWYRRVLGLRVVAEYEHWAEDPKGPLMISSDGGSTKLALFEGRPQGDRETAGYQLVAFRVSGANFERFIERLDELTLTDHHDCIVGRDSVKDHGQAQSLYFNDPYGHRLELTTYVDAEIEVLDTTDAGVDLQASDERALWLCHVCDTPVPSNRGVACSRSIARPVATAWARVAGDDPVCRSCLGEPGS